MKKIVYTRNKTHEDDKELKAVKAGTSAKVILYCIIVTLVLYILMIFIEKSIVNADDKKEVYVAVKQVPDNVLKLSKRSGINDKPSGFQYVFDAKYNRRIHINIDK